MRLMRQSGSVRDRVREVNWNLVVEQAMKFGAANVLGVCSTRQRKWGLPVCRLPGNPPKSPLPGGHCASRGHRAKHTRSFASPYCLPAFLHYGSSIKSSVGRSYSPGGAPCAFTVTRYTLHDGPPRVGASFRMCDFPAADTIPCRRRRCSTACHFRQQQYILVRLLRRSNRD